MVEIISSNKSPLFLIYISLHSYIRGIYFIKSNSFNEKFYYIAKADSFFNVDISWRSIRYLNNLVTPRCLNNIGGRFMKVFGYKHCPFFCCRIIIKIYHLSYISRSDFPYLFWIILLFSINTYGLKRKSKKLIRPESPIPENYRHKYD